MTSSSVPAIPPPLRQSEGRRKPVRRGLGSVVRKPFKRPPRLGQKAFADRANPGMDRVTA